MDEELFKNILAQAKIYFLKNRYQETCGVVFNKRVEFTPIKNETPSGWTFSLTPKLRLIKNKIKIICHSHPFGDAYPSALDAKTAIDLSTPFLIYSCLYDNFVFFDLEKCKPYKV